MIRFFDIFLSIILIVLIIPILILIFLVHIIYIKNSFFFIQERLGLNKKIFKIIKLRTMKINTINTATHNLNGANYTRIGSFLRKTKIDEFPQVLNVLKGEMSFVGPRPCLPNQVDLINQRNRDKPDGLQSNNSKQTNISDISNNTPETDILDLIQRDTNDTVKPIITDIP